ncbi:uncharacterized protein K452DRAFT_289862 [Aplosporella prunicola CBS 121167]|uniref:F-box domain-containing protein n=1 Tax=Aplosporella prunicola CBS 121167 TaxID=1176127 RepID=A0A6A6B594_9PEZI|nr:uncharacterized protein K452DRAFT_289862 [Aplosporella prunicola CBS 121167]KAF2139312.1 hypothetical protein K452DRAFT_289862 [Aplosporella prunicola CBS 121167]
MASPSSDASPTTLLDLLRNSLLLHHTAPYLPTSSLYALARTSKAFHALVFHSPDVFRYLDLSTVRSAIIPHASPLDSGGINWRSERMDEALTEDEFYSGPLRGIFSKLGRRNVLQHVHTLVLDGLSVPADLVREIIAEDRFAVRILSVREAEHLNERKLMQVLKYAVRPSRPEGTPRLKGLYVFGVKDPSPITEPIGKKRTTPPRTPAGVMGSEGAQIGAEWNQKSSDALSSSLSQSEHKWYQSAGRVLHKRPSPEWAETLKACEGIIYFDAVLCRGPRHDISTAYTGPTDDSPAPHPLSYLSPAVASIALGSSGCHNCNSCPEGAAIFGKSPSHHLPLLSPPPLHSSTIQAAQRPSARNRNEMPVLISRCEDCLRGRWCERCNKWWDEDCYEGTGTSTFTAMQQEEAISDMLQSGRKTKKDIKVVGVKRDCFGCGPTCADCRSLYIRSCRTCRNEYCIVDNDGSSSTAAYERIILTKSLAEPKTASPRQEYVTTIMKHGVLWEEYMDSFRLVTFHLPSLEFYSFWGCSYASSFVSPCLLFVDYKASWDK